MLASGLFEMPELVGFFLKVLKPNRQALELGINLWKLKNKAQCDNTCALF